jgi:hypothetical protein
VANYIIKVFEQKICGYRQRPFSNIQKKARSGIRRLRTT